MKPKNFRAPNGVYWVHLGPWTDPKPEQKEGYVWEKGYLTYGEKGGGIYSDLRQATIKRDRMRRRGYLECTIFDSGFIDWKVSEG